MNPAPKDPAIRRRRPPQACPGSLTLKSRRGSAREGGGKADLGKAQENQPEDRPRVFLRFEFGVCAILSSSASLGTDREELCVECPLLSPIWEQFSRSLPGPWCRNRGCSSYSLHESIDSSRSSTSLRTAAPIPPLPTKGDSLPSGQASIFYTGWTSKVTHCSIAESEEFFPPL